MRSLGLRSCLEPVASQYIASRRRGQIPPHQKTMTPVIIAATPVAILAYIAALSGPVCGSVLILALGLGCVVVQFAVRETLRTVWVPDSTAILVAWSSVRVIGLGRLPPAPTRTAITTAPFCSIVLLV